MKKVLVVYFSHSGNTRKAANQIQKSVSGDIFEIQPVNPYPDDYNTVVEQAKRELNADYRPLLKKKINNITDYDIIFIGYPNWWGTFPMPVKSFLLENDLSGKTIIPFCTHEGSGLGRSVSDFKNLCPNSTVLEGQPIWGREAAKTQAADWAKRKVTK
jgi:flavodoxin